MRGVAERPLRRAGTAAIVLIGLVLLLGSVSGCRSDGGDGPVTVSLSTLAAHESRHVGHEVSTTGTVRSWGSGADEQFWIEDGSRNRVGLEPGARVADRVGDEVTVTGRFDFDEESGRVIHIDSVHSPT